MAELAYRGQVETIDGLSGVALVTRDGATVLRAAAGVANAEAGERCTPDTRFQIASVSKQFTAAAVMLLVEEEALGLHEPIVRRMADCPAPWRRLTLHQLLTHTSGMGHWGDLQDFEPNRPGEPREILGRFAGLPLRDAPGSTWHYSSPGYLLTASIVERVSGQAYGDFLTDRLLRPLGMTSTHVGEAPSELAAHGYRAGRRVDAAEFAALPGPGDLWSTVGDLARYTDALNAGHLLSASSREAMVTPHAPMDGAWGTDGVAVASSHGYGYCLGTLAGHEARFHFGDNPGYQSFLGWLPRLDMTVVLLCNDEETDIDGLLRRLVPESTSS
ncbi:hypothetical protein GCM10022245_22210 [Streptomyces mayteni]